MRLLSIWDIAVRLRIRRGAIESKCGPPNGGSDTMVSKRAPFDRGEEVEIRQLHEMEDFAPGEWIDREREIQSKLSYERSHEHPKY